LRRNRLFFALALSGCEMSAGGAGQTLATAASINGKGVIAVDVTGMDPQLAIIRRDAARLDWRVICEGSAGEERVLRLTFPNRSEKAVRSYFDPQDLIGSSTRYYSRTSPLNAVTKNQAQPALLSPRPFSHRVLVSC
jgi:hypothetical protein